MKAQKTLDTSGYTLVETVLVIVFLGIAIVSVMDMMASGLVLNVNNEIATTAINLANEKMEAIFADRNGRGYDYVVEENYPDETDASGFAGYHRSVAITEQANSKEVEIRVTHARIEDCVLIAYLARY